MAGDVVEQFTLPFEDFPRICDIIIKSHLTLDLTGFFISESTCLNTTFIQELKRSKSIKLSKNRIKIQYLKSLLKNLTHLEELRFLNNAIDGDAFVDFLKEAHHLRKLELGGNSLKPHQMKAILDTFAKNNPIEIKIFSNGMNQDSIDSLTNLVQSSSELECFWISGEYEENTKRRMDLKVENLEKALSKLKNITLFGINHFKFSINSLNSFIKEWNISHLELRNCSMINSDITSAISKLRDLRHICLAGCTGTIDTVNLSDSLKSQVNLHYLNFSDLKFDSFESIKSLAGLIGKLKNLQFLLLSKILLDQDSAKVLFESLSHHTKLTTIDLSHNALEKEGIISLSNNLKGLNSLIYLNLEDTSLSDDCSIYISGIIKRQKSLRFLTLSSNKIESNGFGQIVEGLLDKSLFESIKMSKTWVDDKILRDLKSLVSHCSSLKLIDFSACNLTSRVMESFEPGSIPFLEELKLPEEKDFELAKMISERSDIIQKFSNSYFIAEKRFMYNKTITSSPALSMQVPRVEVPIEEKLENSLIEIQKLQQAITKVENELKEKENTISAFEYHKTELEQKTVELTNEILAYRETTKDLKKVNEELRRRNDQLAAQIQNMQSHLSLASSSSASNPSSNSDTIRTSLLKLNESQIRKGTDDFKNSNLLGEGGYGKVFKGVINCVKVAVKCLSEDSLQGKEEFIAEVELLSKYRNPYLVSLIGYSHGPNFKPCYLVYEYLPNGNVEEALKKGKLRSPEIRYNIAVSVAKGMAFLQDSDEKSPVFHRDLKASNILLDHRLEAKIGDFGLMKKGIAQVGAISNATVMTTSIKGTPVYICPEYMRSGKVSRKTDVFSFGMIVAELLTGKAADTNTERLVVTNLTKNKEQNVVDSVMSDWLSKPKESIERKKLDVLFSHTLVCLKHYGQERPTFSLLSQQYDQLESGEAVGDLQIDEEPEEILERECIICRSNPIRTQFEPCRHSCACEECSSKTVKCPICQKKITKVNKGNFSATFV